MASAPSDRGPVLGRVDRNGRLVAADPELERLQVEAGSRVGASLALPQLANVARLAAKLNIPVSRRILAAGREQDVDMWVRAVPDEGEVALSIEKWTVRAASTPRLASIESVEHERLAPDPLVWSVDEQLRLVSVSPPFAELLSTDADSVPGLALTRLFRLEEDDSGAMPLLDALASRSGFTGQRVRTRDGGEALVLNGEVALGPDGDFAGFEGTAVAEATQGGDGKGRSIGVDGAIHTALRSPLDNIVRSAEEMIERSDAPVRPEYAAYASDIATAARHLLSVIRSLGDQREAQDDALVDLATLALGAVGLIESAAKERDLVVGIERTETLYAHGDPRSIIQILVNLIGNAVRYSPPGTAITVSFERTNGSVLVHVADEGPGIDPADHDRIFEPFQKGGDGGEGSGLGLAIARRLARAMGGDIRLASAPTSGSRFSLELPAV